MLKIKNIGLAILLAVVSIGIACDGGQMDEANKLINEGNAIVTKNNELIAKSNALMTELVGGEALKKVEDMEKYKADNKAKFEELIKLNEDLSKGQNEAAAKFEGVSKFKVDDKFKEYTSLKGQEMKKAAEISAAEAAFVKAFLAEKDDEKMSALIAESNKKSEDLKKQSNELRDKAEKVAKDNPNLFK